MSKAAFKSLLILISLVGCAPDPDFVTLDDRWLPLRRIAKTDASERYVYTTVVDVVWTQHTSDFLSLDAVQQAALLSHERVHALAQQREGYANWQRDFSNFPSFRREEELEAWKVQLTVLAQGGEPASPFDVGLFMSTHYGGVFDYDWAVTWVAKTESEAVR